MFILISLLIAFEIMLRKIFNTSTGGTEELSGYGLAIASSWSFAYAVLERVHIRIDFIYDKLSRQQRAVLDVVAVAALLFFFALFLFYGGLMFANSVRVGSRSVTALYIPLAIPQSIWLLGLLFTVVVTVLVLLRALIDLIAGDTESVQELAGTKTISEEVKEELAGLVGNDMSSDTKTGAAR